MSLFFDGLKLMIVGMGMVFFFLTVMIYWVLLSSKLSAKFARLLPDDPKPAPRRAARKPAAAPGVPAAAAGGSQATLAAVVGAAVQMYRRDRGLR